MQLPSELCLITEIHLRIYLDLYLDLVGSS
jgi:hypothetical protein